VFFVLSKTLDLAVAPLTWILVLVAIGVHAAWTTRRARAVGALGGALAVALVLANPMVSNRLWWWLERDAVVSRGDDSSDAVVLLGGMVPHGRVQRGSPPRYEDGVERLLTTYDLLRKGEAGVAIVSGGVVDARGDEAVEASVLAEQLAAWGIARERLVVDLRALNTRQNAIEVARLARERGLRRLLLVTSAFHMPRAAGCFRAVDLPVDQLPVDYRALEPARQPWQLAPRAQALHESTEALREWTGRATYRLLGYSR
jgi:uncharacterized SAM-binding protein YcdF (DUF218 family)